MESPYRSVPLERLVPSPTNPRRSYDQVALEELAASIRKQGVLQPVLVRPLPADHKKPKLAVNGLPLDDASGQVFELVVGERRSRAAKIAGLSSVPAVVVELTDQEVLERQVVENLQREDLHALEEAEGYRRLLAEGKTVAWVSEQTGRSVAYVYDQVKLLSLTKEAQKAFREGAFTPRHAVLLARLSPADQKRAMSEDNALFTAEYSLFDPEDQGPIRDNRKPRSVREFQAWIDKHVRLEAENADPMLFPELVETVKKAAEENEKVVRITHETLTPDEAKDGPKLILGRSWKRADGKQKSKTCDRSVIGTIEIGPHRGEVLRVCVDKKRCTVHWGDLIKAAKKREREVTREASTGETREALRRQKEAAEQAARAAEIARWDRARPAILEAVAAAVRKAPTGAGSTLGKLLLSSLDDNYGWRESKGEKCLVSPGKTAEDLVRHGAFRLLWMDVDEMGIDEFSEHLVSEIGVDARKIVDQVAPVPSCSSCGCTELKPCKGGCGWFRKPDPKTGRGLCTNCADEAPAPKKGKTKSRKAA